MKLEGTNLFVIGVLGTEIQPSLIFTDRQEAQDAADECNREAIEIMQKYPWYKPGHTSVMDLMVMHFNNSEFEKEATQRECR